MLFSETPIHESTIKFSNRIFYKREDLLPYCLGGNKVRIAFKFYEEMERRGCDVMIGYGNSRSNLCRVMANIGGKNFCMIQPENPDGGFEESYNSDLVRFFGSEIVTCERKDIASTIQKVIERFEENGHYPFYMHGDCYGNGNEEIPVQAYVDVYKEIMDQEQKTGIHYDYVFTAAGTCMTLSGLLCGKRLFEQKNERKIIGMATAHAKERGYQNIRKYAGAYLKQGFDENFINEYCEYDDSCLCGGYARACEEIYATINKVLKQDGVPLDYTYTGKAFWGMLKYLERNNIEGKNILFIHTGGLPLFFDRLSSAVNGKN